MPGWLIDIFKDNFRPWIDNPVPFFVALIAGIVLGYLFSLLRHKGKIDGLEERVKLRDEQISVKDGTIQSMSTDRMKLEEATSTTTKAVQPKEPPSINRQKAAPPKSTPDPRFALANERIARNTEERLRALLSEGEFLFVFNPTTGAAKALTFLDNGNIGEGRNANENRWRVSDGRLEILDSLGRTYSRFVLLNDNVSLHHTNDPDTRSLRGQYMKYVKRKSAGGRIVDVTRIVDDN